MSSESSAKTSWDAPRVPPLLSQEGLVQTGSTPLDTAHWTNPGLSWIFRESSLIHHLQRNMARRSKQNRVLIDNCMRQRLWSVYFRCLPLPATCRQEKRVTNCPSKLRFYFPVGRQLANVCFQLLKNKWGHQKPPASLCNWTHLWRVTWP